VRCEMWCGHLALTFVWLVKQMQARKEVVYGAGSLSAPKKINHGAFSPPSGLFVILQEKNRESSNRTIVTVH